MSDLIGEIMKTLYEIDSEDKEFAMRCIRQILVGFNPDAVSISFFVNSEGYEVEVKDKGLRSDGRISMQDVSGKWIQKF